MQSFCLNWNANVLLRIGGFLLHKNVLILVQPCLHFALVHDINFLWNLSQAWTQPLFNFYSHTSTTNLNCVPWFFTYSDHRSYSHVSIIRTVQKHFFFLVNIQGVAICLQQCGTMVSIVSALSGQLCLHCDITVWIFVCFFYWYVLQLCVCSTAAIHLHLTSLLAP